MRTALSFVVECVRNSEARVPQLVFSVTVPEHMFWDVLPAPVLTGRQYRKPLTSDESRIRSWTACFLGDLKRVWEERVSPAVDGICLLVVVVNAWPSAAMCLHGLGGCDVLAPAPGTGNRRTSAKFFHQYGGMGTKENLI